MNLSALPELLLSWVKTQGAALLQGNKAEQVSPFKVGETYEGKVLDQLSSGRQLVQVAGQKLDMGLPQNTRSGDTVRLTFLSAGARPTFLLNTQGSTAPVQSVQISNTAQQVNALMRVSQSAAQSAAQTVVQTTGPAAGQMTGQATSRAPAQSPVTTPGTASQAAQSGARLAAVAPTDVLGVKTAAQSQTKTEAPVAVRANPVVTTAQAPASASSSQAVTSMRPIVANVVMLQGNVNLSATPSTAIASANTGLLGQAVDSMRAAVPASTTLRPHVVADPASPSPNLLPTRLAQTLRESGLFYESHLARWTKGVYPFESVLNEPQAHMGRGAAAMVNMAELAGMPEEAARMAGRQLHMLEGGPFQWQGFAWPGQWMEWQVDERREGQTDGSAADGPNPWTTELRLTLPRMGTVHAQLSLRGPEVSLRMQVAETASAQQLTEALPLLQERLEASGLRPVSLAISTEANV